MNYLAPKVAIIKRIEPADTSEEIAKNTPKALLEAPDVVYIDEAVLWGEGVYAAQFLPIYDLWTVWEEEQFFMRFDVPPLPPGTEFGFLYKEDYLLWGEVLQQPLFSLADSLSIIENVDLFSGWKDFAVVDGLVGVEDVEVKVQRAVLEFLELMETFSLRGYFAADDVLDWRELLEVEGTLFANESMGLFETFTIEGTLWVSEPTTVAETFGIERLVNIEDTVVVRDTRTLQTPSYYSLSEYVMIGEGGLLNKWNGTAYSGTFESGTESAILHQLFTEEIKLEELFLYRYLAAGEWHVNLLQKTNFTGFLDFITHFDDASNTQTDALVFSDNISFPKYTVDDVMTFVEVINYAFGYRTSGVKEQISANELFSIVMGADHKVYPIQFVKFEEGLVLTPLTYQRLVLSSVVLWKEITTLLAEEHIYSTELLHVFENIRQPVLKEQTLAANTEGGRVVWGSSLWGQAYWGEANWANGQEW